MSMRDAGAVARPMVVILLALAVGCTAEEPGPDARGGSEGFLEKSATDASGVGEGEAVASDTASAPCPPTGLWAECSVIARLENAGLVMQERHDDVTEEPLKKHGRSFSVRSAELEVYIYPDRQARERDQRRLDAGHYLTPEEEPFGAYRPTLVTSENLLVILDTRRGRQRERIALALTAGPPQPPQQ